MQESDTYLMILEEGETKASRKIILALGEDRFGPTNESVRNELNNITDLERLLRMARQAAKVASWQEFLDTP